MIIAIGKDAEKLKHNLADEECETYEFAWLRILLYFIMLWIFLDWLRRQ